MLSRGGFVSMRLSTVPSSSNRGYALRVRANNKSLVSVAEPFTDVIIADTRPVAEAKQTERKQTDGSVLMTLQHSAKVNGGVYNGAETYTGQEITTSHTDVTALRESDHAGSKWANMNPLASEVSEKKPVNQVRAKTNSPSGDEEEKEEKEEEKEEEELTERERTRREKISIANTGKVPWNKGRKHSEATKERIRMRTLEAMKRPEVVRKLKAVGLAQRHSEETRAKISAKLKEHNMKVKEARVAQLILIHGPDWEKVEEERSLEKKRVKAALRREKTAAARAEREKNRPPPEERAEGANNRSPKSEEHKQRIAEAIRVKWQDSLYRERVCAGIQNHMDSRGPRPAPIRRFGGAKKKAPTAMERRTLEQLAAMEARSKMKEQLRNKAMLLLGEAERAASALEAKAHQTRNPEDAAAAAMARQSVDVVMTSLGLEPSHFKPTQTGPQPLAMSKGVIMPGGGGAFRSATTTHPLMASAPTRLSTSSTKGESAPSSANHSLRSSSRQYNDNNDNDSNSNKATATRVQSLLDITYDEALDDDEGGRYSFDDDDDDDHFDI